MRQSGGQRYRQGYDAQPAATCCLQKRSIAYHPWNTLQSSTHTTGAGHPCRKDIRMIAAEMKNEVSTVRIHDEYYVSEPHGYIAQLNQIVSNSYKRRMSARLMPTNCQPDSVDSLP